MIGSGVSALIAMANGWVPVIPPLVLVAGVSATLVIGAIAGLYPAIRAARTPPTVALSSCGGVLGVSADRARAVAMAR